MPPKTYTFCEISWLVRGQRIHLLRREVTDFESSKREKETVLRMKINCGTSGCMAPELLPKSQPHRSYASSVDIWSLGTMTHGILTLEIAFLQIGSEWGFGSGVSARGEYDTSLRIAADGFQRRVLQYPQGERFYNGIIGCQPHI